MVPLSCDSRTPSPRPTLAPARSSPAAPNVLAATVIGFLGWLIAKVLRELVSSLLGAAGLDRAGAKVGLGEGVRLSQLSGTIVFVLVFVPALIAALDALKVEAISAPATEMLGKMLAAIPDIFAAALILVISWFVARFAAALLAQLLASMGFDRVPEKIGLANAFRESTASALVGKVLFFFAMLFATVEAANRLAFSQVSDLVSMFIQFGGEVLLGSAILVVGYWLAGVAYEAIKRTSGESAKGLASVARAAILGLVLAMGLRAMGIADDIVNLAFALVLGGMAVAFALAFGLGGREPAGKLLENWFARFRKQ